MKRVTQAAPALPPSTMGAPVVHTGWTPETSPDYGLGLENAYLLPTIHEWTWRHAHAVSFPDCVTCSHEHVITLTVPQLQFRDEDGPRAPTFLPVAYLPKDSLLSSLRLSEVDTQALPVLPRALNDWLTWSTLVVSAEALLEQDPTLGRLSGSLTETLKRVAFGEAIDGADAARDFIQQASVGDTGTDSRQARFLCGYDVFVRSVVDLGTNWIVHVPTSSFKGDREITLSLSYTDWIAWGPRDGRIADHDYRPAYLPPYIAPRVPPAQRQSRGRKWHQMKWRHFLRSAWIPPTFAVSASGLLAARSYHIIVDAPPGLYVTNTDIIYELLDGSPCRTAGQVGGSRGHAYMRGSPTLRDPRARFSFTLIGRGLIRYAAVAGLFAAVILTLTLATLDRLYDIGSTTGAAVLLGIPSVALGLLARPDDHDLPSIMRIATKFWLFVSALLLYAAGILLIVRPPIRVLFLIWSLLSLASWFSAWFLGKSYMTPRRILAEAGKESPAGSLTRSQGAGVDGKIS